MEGWSIQKRILATMLLASGCIKLGSFTLKSGLVSPIYIDLRATIAFPDLLKRIALEYITILDQLHFNQIAALPYAALPIGTAICLEKGVPMLYPRKETKNYGTKASIEGRYSNGEKVVIIDDLITSGASVYEALEKLNAAHLLVQDVVVLVDRQSGGIERLTKDGYTIHSVFKINELLHYWKSERLIPVDTYLLVCDFLNGGM